MLDVKTMTHADRSSRDEEAGADLVSSDVRSSGAPYAGRFICAAVRRAVHLPAYSFTPPCAVVKSCIGAVGDEAEAPLRSLPASEP